MIVDGNLDELKVGESHAVRRFSSLTFFLVCGLLCQAGQSGCSCQVSPLDRVRTYGLIEHTVSMQRDPVVSKASELLRLGLMPSPDELRAGKVSAHFLPFVVKLPMILTIDTLM